MPTPAGKLMSGDRVAYLNDSWKVLRREGNDDGYAVRLCNERTNEVRLVTTVKYYLNSGEMSLLPQGDSLQQLAVALKQAVQDPRVDDVTRIEMKTMLMRVRRLL